MYLLSELTPKGDSKSALAEEEVEKARAAETRRWVEGLLATEFHAVEEEVLVLVDMHRAVAKAGARGAAVAALVARAKMRLEEDRSDIVCSNMLDVREV